MTNITDLLQQSELRTDILTIARNLQTEEYTNHDAIDALLQFLEKHNL